MKKIILFFAILLLFNTNISYSNNNGVSVNLIEDYIYNLKSEINILVKKYNIDNNLIEQQIIEINKLLNIISNLKNKNYSQNEYNKIIEYILYNIKTNKDQIKNIIKRKQKEIDDKKQLYYKIGLNLQKSLNIIINNNYYIYRKKEFLNNNDYQMINILKNLSSESLNLKYFNNKIFYSTEDMKNEFKTILINIKKEMIKIKNFDTIK